MKWAVLFTALVSVVGFSSCLDSEGGQSNDLFEYVTVESYMGATTLVGDQSGLMYIPVSADVLASLEMKDGSYYKRAMVGIKLAEPYDPNNIKTSYKISAIQVYNYIPYKDCTMSPDTLVGDYNFINVGSGNSKPWVKNGFANVTFSVQIPNAQPSLNDFHLYLTGSSNDTLFAKLRYTNNNSTSYTTMSEMVSFQLPNNAPSFIQTPTDSLVLTVVANTANGLVTTTSSKFSRNDLY